MAAESDRDLTLAGLVHDLNNVFETIGEAADLMDAGGENRELAAAIHRSVERGRRITSSIVQRARAPVAAGQPLEWAAGFVRDVASFLPRSRFEVHVESDAATVLPGPSSDWERVFMNLFLNALQATGGVGNVHARAGNDGEEVCIRVTDDGPGIPAPILGQLFHAGVSTRGVTCGLGLSIVESIVQRHNGHVNAVNRPGGGACFEIRIPSFQTG